MMMFIEAGSVASRTIEKINVGFIFLYFKWLKISWLCVFFESFFMNKFKAMLVLINEVFRCVLTVGKIRLAGSVSARGE